ncbi:SpvB/TcaC N-terminal domain-containing protein [uncultured Serinicoccus sp.]|uniref:SpvB/TcaC N-terminal domain-containing protein n=1 Tax=uncultured Serinicoccus sp. TaxID=735514 RepID=UPI002620978F|nr:SpvB/TcaC N-terminal domain-containing protein [uncultured Serinicoccus sp.]
MDDLDSSLASRTLGEAGRRGERAGADARGEPAADANASLPSVTKPRGGGAIKGVAEKFAANPATGTGSLTIPLPLSPGRTGFGPDLSLHYDSSAGNGPFGFGWSLNVPRISRKTERGLPQYLDEDESDIFILSGAEDLVPVVDDGQRHRDDQGAPGFVVRRYRPRTEGLFARIERWTHGDTGAIHWRTISRDNVTTLYGLDDGSRIDDPTVETGTAPRTFVWLAHESYDDKGNAIAYEYVQEDDKGVSETVAEIGRHREANRYLREIRYGNSRSRLTDPTLASSTWRLRVLFDYGQGHERVLQADPGLDAREQFVRVRASVEPTATWSSRPDPFSSYRSGFEVRTQRRCHRILMFHDFPELGPRPQLVRSLDLEYDDLGDVVSDGPGVELGHQGSTGLGSFLRRVTQHGFVPDESATADVDGVTMDGYRRCSMPPTTFTYSRPRINDKGQRFDPTSIEDVPGGLGGNAEWVDLDGEGLAGVLWRTGGAWHYKQNRGDGVLAGLRTVDLSPPATEIGSDWRLSDLSGDGQLDIVTYSRGSAGFHERRDRDWTPFRPFEAAPTVPPDDEQVRLVDLTGDGLADLLLSDNDGLTWLDSLGEAGFGDRLRPGRVEDDPTPVLDDGSSSILLADMSGDGLSDLVRVRNGDVRYWPSLGHGRFGSPVVMADAPEFDSEENFDPRRVRLADLDGSGTSDAVYLGATRVTIHLNRSGNSWTAEHTLESLPGIEDPATVQLTDILGNGMACILDTRPAVGHEPAPSYVPVLGSDKPHLLTGIDNGMGGSTSIEYAPSTRFYLEDLRAGRPWLTSLPFPVHVVTRMTTEDRIARTRFSSRWSYHHGYFDGAEREFRGFAYVEQRDTEELAALTQEGELPPSNVNGSSHVPPVLTKTWFHTGARIDGDDISERFAHLVAERDDSYFREPGDSAATVAARRLPDVTIPPRLTAAERREASRALRGAMLRREVYALDQTDRADRPYLVEERSHGVRMVQPRHFGAHAVMHPLDDQQLTIHYDRSSSIVAGGMLVPDGTPGAEELLDPRIEHSFALETDDVGNVVKSAAVAYARRYVDPALPQPIQHVQAQPLVTATEIDTTDRIDQADAHRTPVACETRTYELTGYAPANPDGLFQTDDLVGTGVGGRPVFLTDGEDVDPAQVPPAGRRRRLIGRERVRFRADDLSGPLGLGQLGRRALPDVTETLALTPMLVTKAFDGRVDDALLVGDGADPAGGYVHSLDRDGVANPGWWVSSPRVFYTDDGAATTAAELAQAEEHFFLPRRTRDTFHRPAASTEGIVHYDEHDFVVVSSVDAAGNEVTAGERAADGTVTPAIDYRMLQPRIVTDPNRNRTEFAFDALGRVAAIAVAGTTEEGGTVGDALPADFDPDLTDARLDELIADPAGVAAASTLGTATQRLISDPRAVSRSGGGAAVWTLALSRRVHAAADDPVPTSFEVALSYADGLAQEVQRKQLVEPGPVPRRAPDGSVVLDADGHPEQTDGAATPRWVASGWRVLNNKGQAVREYEPFFTDRHAFEFDVRVGVSPILCRDPIGRVVATMFPDQSWSKVVVSPWSTQLWDAGDTVKIADPTSDADVGPLLARLPPREVFPTWFAQRAGGAMGPHELAAAERSRIHAATPSVEHGDPLGRVVLTVAHNRTRYSDTPAAPPMEELLATRAVLDVLGRQQQVFDALGREVVRYVTDLAGAELHSSSMEAGRRWFLRDAAGADFCTWDDRDHQMRTLRDVLRRAVETRVVREGADDIVLTRTTYGEGLLAPEDTNHRTRVAETRDQAGLVTMESYDFKGNPLFSSRRTAVSVNTGGVQSPAHRGTVDWSAAVKLSTERYRSTARYDALDRVVQVIAPHATDVAPTVHVTQPVHGPGGRLQRVDVWLERPGLPTGLLDPDAEAPSGVGVGAVAHDAAGRRLVVAHGNGAVTQNRYHPRTRRLVEVYTRRDERFTDCDNPIPPPALVPAPPSVAETGACGVQLIAYTHDVLGAVTRRADRAQPRIFFANAVVDPIADYTYDAIGRLVEATGREHLGQGLAPIPHDHRDARRIGRLHPHDGNALGRYLERYRYDAVGNITEMEHVSRNPAGSSWSRMYRYDEPSQLDPARVSNRLTSTTVGGTTSTYSTGGDGYDRHGNMLRMPHLQGITWNEHDQLQSVRRQAVGPDDAHGLQHAGDRTYYVYGADGARVRKVTETTTGAIRSEWLYLDGLDVQFTGGPGGVTRQTLHVGDGSHRVALVDTRTSGSEPNVPRQVVRYQYTDVLGSVGVELDGNGQLLTFEEYSAYGSSTLQVSSSPDMAPKRYRFTGMERDDESGLAHHGARYYAPWLGRWTSADPSGLADGPNLFLYARSNPVGFSDRNGAQSESEWSKFLSDLVEKFDDAFEGMTTGKYRRQPMKLNVDEIDAVKGDLAGGVAGSPSDPANKQHLDSMTNQATKGNRVGPQPHRRPPVSIADSPVDAANRLITGPLDEVVEVREHFDEATKAVRPGKRTNASGVARVRTDSRVTQTLKAIGVDYESGTFFNPKGVDQFPKKGSTVRMSPADAEVDHKGRAVARTSRASKGVGNKPKGPKVKGLGTLGKIANLGVAAYVFWDTGSAYAAAQTANPLANTTDASLDPNSSRGARLKAVAQDVYEMTPIPLIISGAKVLGSGEVVRQEGDWLISPGDMVNTKTGEFLLRAGPKY